MEVIVNYNHGGELMLTVTHIIIALIIAYVVAVACFLYYFVNLYAKLYEHGYDTDINYRNTKPKLVRKCYGMTLLFVLILSPSIANFSLFFALAPVFMAVTLISFYIKKEWRSIGYSPYLFWGLILLMTILGIAAGRFVAFL